MQKSNFVVGDKIKYFGVDNQVTMYEIVGDYYTARVLIHMFVLLDSIGRITVTKRAADVYKSAKLKKGMSDERRAVLTGEKKRKLRLAKRGMRN